MDNRNGILVDGLYQGGFIPNGEICAYISRTYGVSQECCTAVCEVIRQLMLAGFCLLFAVGCGEGRNISKPDPEIQARAKVYSTSFSREVAAIEKIDTVATKQDALSTQVDAFASKSLELNQEIVEQLKELNSSILETRRAVGTMEASLATPKPQQLGGDPADLEPQEIAKEANTASPSSASPAVRLQFFTQEKCAPCVQQSKNAQAAADELGIMLEIFHAENPKHIPAFEQASIDGTPKTLVVVNGEIRERFAGVVSAAAIVSAAKKHAGFASQPVITKSFVSQPDLVSIHNQLHGGGNWTWPGDLATHLRTVHGYGIQTQSAPMVNRGSSCPGGNCPTPRSLKMRWGR